MIRLFFLFLSLIMSIFVATRNVSAAETSPINATVSLSICGNGIAEPGEDCDDSDFKSETCISLGYAEGSLACDASCSFETSACTVPTINPNNVTPEEINSLVAAGYLTVPPTESVVETAQVTTSGPITINIPDDTETSHVYLPENIVITQSDDLNYDPRDFDASSITHTLLSGFSSNTEVEGVIHWGIAGTTMEFDSPINIEVFVGNSLNGEILSVVRSSNLNSGWTSDGIVSPATCTVTAGHCGFQTSKASYFAATISAVTPTPTSTPGPTSTPTPAPTTSITPTPSITQTSTPKIKSRLPSILRIFYADSEGKLRLSRLFDLVKNWVDSWKKTLIVGLGGEKCDIDNDGDCDLRDFSILLYFVEK